MITDIQDMNQMLRDEGWSQSGATEWSRGEWSLEVRALRSRSFHAETYHYTAPSRVVATIISPSLEVFKKSLP